MVYGALQMKPKDTAGRRSAVGSGRRLSMQPGCRLQPSRLPGANCAAGPGAGYFPTPISLPSPSQREQHTLTAEVGSGCIRGSESGRSSGTIKVALRAKAVHKQEVHARVGEAAASTQLRHGWASYLDDEQVYCACAPVVDAICGLNQRVSAWHNAGQTSR